MTAFDEQVLAEIGPLREAGFALHWLHAKEKRPIGDDWTTRPVATLDSLRRRHESGNNLGVRLGFPLIDGSILHAIDLDIRDPAYAAEAHAKLDELFPAIADSVPSVISGSGGLSRHYYFGCERAFPSKKLARSDTFKMVFDPKLGREVKKRDWEIELFGAPKQIAMPPSIHPDTGLPYQWERPVDLDGLALGLFPRIPAARLEELGVVVPVEADNLELKPPLGLDEDEAAEILNALPLEEYCEDRDGWLQVGMALHHEFGGDDTGFDIWCEFSRQSDKFDEKDQRIVWNSFRAKPNSVRMASLKAVANQVKLLEAFNDIDDDEDEENFDDLIGTPAAADDFDAVLSEGADAGLHWSSLLHFNEEGQLKATLHNLRLIVENDIWTAGVVAYNEFTQEVVQRGQPGHKNPKRKNSSKQPLQLEGASWTLKDPVNGDFWTEDKDNAIRALIEAPTTQGGYGIKVPDRDLRAAIDIAGRKNPFHPVREYLQSLKWDGRARVERLFVDYLGAPDDAYHRSAANIMMVAAVTRVFEPGHKFDSAVILEGLQGKRKSTFISILAKGWFTELNAEFEDTKSIVETLQGAWIVEMPELSGFAKADVRHIKAFISRRSDKVRLAYAKRAQEYQRQSVLIGSTNDDVYLKDQTGGRRFLPVKCAVDRIDTDRLMSEIDQLWAEAQQIYLKMRREQPHGALPLYLVDEEASEMAARLQESRMVESTEAALAGQIHEWLESPINDGGFDDLDGDEKPRFREKVCLLEIWVDCLGREASQYIGSWPSTLGRAMRMVPGWIQTGKRDRFGAYGQQRGFVRTKRRMQDCDLDVIG